MPEPSSAAAAEGAAAPRVPARSFATARPVAVAVVFLATVVFGWLSYFRLPVTLMPELAYPTLTVRTVYPGAAPEEVENEVSRPIEEALGVIGGLRRVSSISRAGVSDVVLEFSWDTPMSDGVQDTLEKLDQVFLPAEAERPLVLRFDPSLDPVMELALSGEAARYQGEEGLRRLRRLAELQVKRQLEPIKGVAAVQVRGGLEEEIHVLLDEGQLRRTGLSADQVIQRLRQENVNLAGGTLKEGTAEYMVRTLNEYQDLEQIADTVVVREGGRDIRLRDIARIERGHKERQIATRADGAPSVQLEIYKEADANLVSLAHRVEAALGSWEAGKPAEETADAEAGAGEAAGKGDKGKDGPGPPQTLPLAGQLFRDEGVKLQIVADRSEFIESSIDEVLNTAILGGLLAVVVLFLFLGSVRTTAIVAVAIPASLLVAFAPLNILGVSLNIMSLGGLALGVGMLVDSSIVVLESIFRCREEGDGLVDAVVRGTAEVRSAVVASTLTSIAVFFPMVFVEGVAGQAFGDLGLAVIVSLLASLAVALWLIPMLAARRGLVAGERQAGFRLFPRAAWRSFRADLAATWRGGRLWTIPFRAVFTLYLALRLVVGLLFEGVAAVVVALLLALGALFGLLLRFVLRPLGRLLQRGPLTLVARLLDRVGAAYSRTVAAAVARPVPVLGMIVACLLATGFLFSRLDTELLPQVHQGELSFELALPPGTPLEETEALLSGVEAAILAEREHIESLLVTFGFDPAQSRRSDEGEHTARFKIVLDQADPRVEEEVIARLRRQLAAVPALDQRVERPVLFSFKSPIEVEIHGDDLVALGRQAAQVETVLAGLPELADVESTLRTGAPEVEVVYDRERLSRYGLELAPVAERVRTMVRGTEASLFNLVDRRVPIVVRLQEEDRRSVADLRDLVVNPGGERPIPLAAVADVQLGEGPSEVRRIDGRRVALVRANLGEGSLGEAVAAIERALARDVEWPNDLGYVVAGQHEEWQRSAGTLWLALALSVFLVYVIMAAQFESLLYPFIVLFSIPLAFFGTALTMWVLGTNLSIVVFLGMIMLAGIVVNNAIVLVDYANLLKSRGLSSRDAVRQAGEVRLRPILMTTATTVLGLLPMAIGLGDGAELRTPMALAVISGLSMSTLLTLIAIPSLYALLDGFKERLLRPRAVAERADEGAGLPAQPEGAA